MQINITFAVWIVRFANISLHAGILALAVILVRAVFPKMPKTLRCLLWGIVGVRLILPFSVESPLSLLPTRRVFPANFAISRAPEVATGSYVLNSAVNPVLEEFGEQTYDMASNGFYGAGRIFFAVWAIGAAALLLYAAVSALRLRHTVREAIKTEKNVYLCDGISSPFILGILRPKIYLPSSLDRETAASVLAHERTHLKRLDHIWKPLGWLLLSLYWFHPLLWVAYILLCRDIEAACDERAVRDLAAPQRAAYAEALLSLATRGRAVSACPLAFGETGVKGRVKNVLSYKKPAFWVILVSLLFCAAVAVCFFTVPDDGVRRPDRALRAAADEALTSYAETSFADGEFACAGFYLYGAAETENGETLVFCRANLNGFGFRNGYFSVVSGMGGSHWVLTFSKGGDGAYRLDNFEFAPGGENYESQIRDLFPEKIADKVLSGDRTAERAADRMTRSRAETYVKSLGRTDPVGFAPDWGEREIVSETATDLLAAWGFPTELGEQEQIVSGERIIATVARCGDGDLVAYRKTGENGVPYDIFYLDPMGHLRNAYPLFGEYTCAEARDFDGAHPKLFLAPEEKTARLSFSFLSSYLFIGRFSVDEVGITLTDAESKYRFLAEDDCSLCFDKAASEGYIYALRGGERFYRPGDAALSAIYDQADFDLDGNGVTDHVVLTRGVTSGLFSFQIAAYETGVKKYEDVIVTDPGELSFTDADPPQVRLETETGTRIFDLAVADGHVLVTENGKPANLLDMASLRLSFASFRDW